LPAGTFSNAAKKFPKFFDYEFFRTYPYFLPCLISAMFAAAGGLLGYFFLEEVKNPRSTPSIHI
jgi:hypothetical protein